MTRTTRFPTTTAVGAVGFGVDTETVAISLTRSTCARARLTGFATGTLCPTLAAVESIYLEVDARAVALGLSLRTAQHTFATGTQLARTTRLATTAAVGAIGG